MCEQLEWTIGGTGDDRFMGRDAMTDHDSGWSGDELSAVFARLADSLDPRHDVIDTMDLLVQSAVNFTSAVECGIVLADGDGVLHVVASTSERTTDVEEAELGTEQGGPCLDSYRSGQVVETPDVSASHGRWPIFAQVAEQRGFRAGYAVPLTLRGQHLGAMNLFFDRTDAVTDRDAAVAQALAEFATIGIVQRRALQHHADRAAQLQHALDSRVVIEQAKGVLAFQRSISIDEAFKLLRQYARNTGARIHDVAERIVYQRLSI
jgi:GAF domain-containing protein